jgi:hypothetical protein
MRHALRQKEQKEELAMPMRPRSACPICRRVQCTCPAKQRRPQSWQERTQAEHVVAAWIEEHGYVCPGYKRAPHASTDLTADHIMPLHLGGDPLGEMQVLCRSCNSRRGAETAHAAHSRGGSKV